ncbi:MAG: FeoA family protein [Pleurocapsa sp. MO_226.B13]|nr:FeoA family protein [Pleurocapsa sp. MO_226.B13]
MLTSISELSLGSVAIVAGYSWAYGGYIGKLISKGLIPGTPFVLINLSLAQGAVQIMIKEKIIVLSKPEVNALCIETLTEDDLV